jgi:hypothetical protein
MCLGVPCGTQIISTSPWYWLAAKKILNFAVSVTHHFWSLELLAFLQRVAGPCAASEGGLSEPRLLAGSPVFPNWILALLCLQGVPRKWCAYCVCYFWLHDTMEYARDMYACKFNHTKNTLKYERLHSKLGVVCTRISQDILVYTGTYWVDKVNGLHIIFFFTFHYRIRCKVPFHISWDILRYPSMTLRLDILGYPGIFQDTRSHPGGLLSRCWNIQHPFPKPIKNVAWSAKWNLNVHIWNQLKNALVGSTLECWMPGIFSVPTSEDLNFN